MKNKKFYVVGGGHSYINWILMLGFKQTKNPEEADIFFFTGGADVSPELYGQDYGSYLGADWERDVREREVFNFSKDKFKIGVCRGGQFLTVMNGYSLVQHMRHPSRHDTYTFDGQVLESTSTHHNQFLLLESHVVPPSPYSLVGWAKKLSDFHLDEHDKDYKFSQDYKEPEIVLYDGTSLGRGKSLAIQMHPEFFALEHPTVKYLQNFLLQHID